MMSLTAFAAAMLFALAIDPVSRLAFWFITMMGCPPAFIVSYSSSSFVFNAPPTLRGVQSPGNGCPRRPRRVRRRRRALKEDDRERREDLGLDDVDDGDVDDGF